MAKSIKIKQRTNYNVAIIARLKEKHGFTSHFIYASLRGDRTSESSVKIITDYEKMEVEVKKILDKL